MKISLAKALKLKNKLVANINKLHGRIIQNNSYNAANKPAYDVKKVMEEYDAEMRKLIALKTLINTKNVAITQDILEMGELKNKISIYRSIPTTEGESSRGYRNAESTPQVWVAVITQVQLDVLIENMEAQIETIQDKIDHFNATTEIEFVA